MAIAELEVLSTERSSVLPGRRMRTVWQLDAGTVVAPPSDRRALATSLHQLLVGWRAAERQVAELIADREAVSRPEASLLLESIATYRAEHRRIFEDIRRLALVDDRTVDGDDFGRSPELH